MTRRHAHVVNVEEIEPQTRETGTKFGAKIRSLSRAAGSKDLGCQWYELAPGRASFPKHYHCATEEAVYVLEGAATLRIGADEVAVRAGDYLAFPVGPEAAHQVVNRSSAPVRYLCFSTKPKTDVVGYPDSNKFAATASGDEDAWATGKFWVREIHKVGTGIGYFDGEDVG